MRTEILVLGGGVAGLRCAVELHRAGASVTLIEASTRLGGRILTHRQLGQSTPLELGAEFIHGAPPETLGWLARGHLPFYDVTDEHLFWQPGRGLRSEPHFFDRIEKVMNHLNPTRKVDRSVRHFLTQQKLRTPLRELFVSFVEGFHAASLDRIGEKGLALTEQTDDPNLNGASMFRLPGGYDLLVEQLRRELPDEAIHLQTRAVAIHHEGRSGHRVSTQSGPDGHRRDYRARHLVVALPWGVLSQPDALHWDPPPSGWAKLQSRIVMGHVQRMNLRFRDRFWEDLSEDPVSFLHAGPQFDFPTWWSLHPLRAPVLVAWQGGPRAEALTSLSEAERVRRALGTLSKITGRSTSFLRRQLISVHAHNWSEDPLFRGAYSFVGVDGASAARRLQRPFPHQLYFAGEATVLGSARGTVHGALQSGLRAARQILKARGLNRE